MKKLFKFCSIVLLVFAVSFSLCACNFSLIDLGTKTTVKSNKLPQSEIERMPDRRSSSNSTDRRNLPQKATSKSSLKNSYSSSKSEEKSKRKTVGKTERKKKNTKVTKTVNVNISEYENIGTDIHPIEYAISDLKNKAIANRDTRYVLNLKNTTYKFDRTLDFTNCVNIEINGNGSKFIWTKEVKAFNISKCTNLKFSNLSIDYDPVNFLQGVVSSVSGSVFKVKLDVGYPTYSQIFSPEKTTTFQLHDSATGAVKENSKDTYYLDGCSEVSKSEIQAKMTYTYNDSRMPKVGDAITLWQSKERTVTIEDSEKTIFDSVNIYNAGFGIYEENGIGGSVFTNCNLIPGPRPSGAKKDRLRFSTRDATHFACLEKGPSFNNCTITHCGDDCINVHGFFYYVAKIEGNKITLHGKYGNPLEKDDIVVAYSKGDYKQFATAKVTSCKTMNDESVASIVQDIYQENGSEAGTISYSWVEVITVDKKISGLKVGDTIVPTTRQGNGTIVKNCKLGYNRARGILVKGQNSTIENNTITNCTGAGILLWQEVSWQEGGFISNLSVKNNTIKDCLRSFEARHGASNVDSYGAITLGMSRASDGVFRNCYENNSIVIESNVIEKCGGYGIFASNVTNLTISKNKITNPFVGGINSIGEVFGLKPKSGIVIGQANTVYTVDNKVKTNNSAISKAVEVLLNCTQVNSSGDKLN